jgi:hypothetical protein
MVTTRSINEDKAMEEQAHTRTRNIFEDPAIADAAKDDPVVRFISQNWKTVVGALVAVALSMIAYNGFQTTAEQKRAVATQTFLEIQNSYRSIVAKQKERAGLTGELANEKDAKKKGELEQKIADADNELKQLRDRTSLVITALNSPKPFDMLSQMYRGLLAARFGDYATTEAALTSTSWEAIGAADSAERMAAEFAALGLARALMDAPASVGAAQDALVRLASKGNFAAVPAGLALSITATTPEEKGQAVKILDELSNKFPAQQKFLTPALEQVRAQG